MIFVPLISEIAGNQYKKQKQNLYRTTCCLLSCLGGTTDEEVARCDMFEHIVSFFFLPRHHMKRFCSKAAEKILVVACICCEYQSCLWAHSTLDCVHAHVLLLVYSFWALWGAYSLAITLAFLRGSSLLQDSFFFSAVRNLSNIKKKCCHGLCMNKAILLNQCLARFCGKASWKLEQNSLILHGIIVLLQEPGV